MDYSSDFPDKPDGTENWLRPFVYGPWRACSAFGSLGPWLRRPCPGVPGGALDVVPNQWNPMNFHLCIPDNGMGHKFVEDAPVFFRGAASAMAFADALASRQLELFE